MGDWLGEKVGREALRLETTKTPPTNSVEGEEHTERAGYSSFSSVARVMASYRLWTSNLA